MKKLLSILAALALLGIAVVAAPAGADEHEEEVPTCGPPGEEVPATIVGMGLIKGTPGDDVIVGSMYVDRIFGFGGNDIICGLGGNDFINGGGGDDLLIGDGDGALPPFAPSNGDNDDTLVGGAGNDTLVGLAGDDSLNGGGGMDFMIGMGGNDVLRGGANDDAMFGGPGDDSLFGNGGNDLMYGNYGSDLLFGGGGDDFLVGDLIGEGGPLGGGASSVEGTEPPFDPGTNDDRCQGDAGMDDFAFCETIFDPGQAIET